MKKLLLMLTLALAIGLVFTSAYAGKLSVIQENAMSGKEDKGTLSAFSQYGQVINVEGSKNQTKFKIEDLVRDGLQTKLSFRVSNIETDRFEPSFYLKDNFGNIYKGKTIEIAKHDKQQKQAYGVMEFEPITGKDISSLELFVEDRVSKLDWNVSFKVDSERVGPETKKHVFKKSTQIENKAVELVEIHSTPSVAKVYLNTDVGLWYGEIKDTNGEVISQLMAGFAPLEKQGNWTEEWTFDPVPEKTDLILEIHTKAKEVVQIPFKLN